ncbi:GntR family transcriptional regulator [Sagittula stellata]|uniref:Transcriptional regulator, GntR family protein n=1 Tax=Sagittula stellata (strain ATCC 700073 / DSM 11524 / E-37) TaxID=388399 RepID=A3K2K1_SAGS3|nr:GntR family transcriptional regulator [Sagittula stellata]EBA08410.1 Transcriptional regulator, GntR family protein [Sagittula stellata E-37]
MTVNKKTACLDDLRMRILKLDLPPGAELDETQVAAGYGLSRTPLREVFQVLAGEGYLRLEHNRGARVAAMDLAALRCLLQTGPLLLATMARQAAENREDAALPALRDAQAAFAAATDEGDAAAAALSNHSFHTQIACMAANPYLMPALRRLLIDHTRLTQGFFQPVKKKEKKQVRKVSQYHAALTAAIEAQDPEAAVSNMLQNWDLFRERIGKLMTPEALPISVETAEAMA